MVGEGEFARKSTFSHSPRMSTLYKTIFYFSIPLTLSANIFNLDWFKILQFGTDNLTPSLKVERYHVTNPIYERSD